MGKSMVAEDKIAESGYDCEHTDLRDAFASVQGAYFELAESHQHLESWLAELAQRHASAQAALDRAESRFSNLLQALPAAVVILDGEGRVRDFNDAARDLLVDIGPGRPWVDVVAASFAPRWDDGHDITLKRGRRVNLSTQPLHGEPGQIVLLKDVTETRGLQDEVNRHRRLASMGEMAAALAHQVRTPLASAILYLSNVRLGRGDEALRQKCIDQAMNRLQHLERLVADMLLFARGGAFDAAEVTLSDLLRELANDGGSALDAFRIEVLDTTGSARVRGNRDALASALRNLIDNARQACGGNGSMMIEAVTDGDDMALLRFTDDGPGIPANLRETIFEPFFTTRMGGSGLGLAVTQAVIRAHGGEITLEPPSGGGSTFLVRLPLQGAAAESTPATAAV